MNCNKCAKPTLQSALSRGLCLSCTSELLDEALEAIAYIQTDLKTITEAVDTSVASVDEVLDKAHNREKVGGQR